MVIAPPLADLHHPPTRWQTVFLSTRPLVGKSVQNGERCGIYATARLQPALFRPDTPRLFRNTSQRDRRFPANGLSLGGTVTAIQALPHPALSCPPGIQPFSTPGKATRAELK